MQQVTLTDILLQRKSLDKKGITFIDGSKQEEFFSYQALYHAALRGLSFLQARGLQPGNELVFQVADNKSFIIIFWACILGGFIPVPLSVGQNDDHRRKLFNVWPVLNNPCLVTSPDTLEKLQAFAQLNNLDDIYLHIEKNIVDKNAIISSPVDGVIFTAKPDDIAFIQFSSGSTGNPKGVILTHKNLITNLAAISNAACYTSDDSVISWMPLTHDMGLIGFHLNPLFSEMDQYLIPTTTFIRRPVLWLEKASGHKVTILCSPNFGYTYFMRHCNEAIQYNWDLSSVRILYNGAEPISEKVCDEFLQFAAPYGLKRYAMCPVYGLAEATLAVSISGLQDEVIALNTYRTRLNFGDTVSIVQQDIHAVSFVNVGKPIDHCSLRIADQNNIALAEGVIGNIQVKGDNITSGYYNNETETKNIITADGWLRTGDLGFIMNSCLYITGRAKDILFVNGQNYYPHDIERVAEQIEGIELNKIAVTGFFNADRQQEEIIAFVYYKEELEKFVFLARALKAYINLKTGVVLDKVIPVTDIPRTTSGKLQRFKLTERYKRGSYTDIESTLQKLLNEPAGDTVNIQQPANDTEQKLVEIWQNILHIHSVGIDQPFFALGGNSLKAAQMGMQVWKIFGVELPADLSYEKQTVRELAVAIGNGDRQRYIPVPQAKKQLFYPVSPAQKRIYYAWYADRMGVAYNIPIAFRIDGDIDSNKLEECIKILVQRHDVLMTTFHMQEEPVYTVHQSVEVELKSIECLAGGITNTLQHLVQPFDLESTPLLRINLLHVHAKEYILFIDFHHIISDGLSVYNFMSELLQAYNGNELPELTVDYKDFVAWEQKNMHSEKLQRQAAYWNNTLHGELPVLEMPLDFSRPVIFKTAGEKIRFECSKEISRSLRDLAGANQCTLHVLLFTIYNILLSKYTGQEEIVAGIPVSGRMHADLQELQGMFVNNLAIRSSINGHDTFIQLLEKEKKIITQALNNQDYPFDHLVQSLPGTRDISRNPVFDTMFNYQNMGLPGITAPGFTISKYFFDPGFSKFDVSMEVFNDGDCIEYNIEYATSLFKRDTILQLAAHFNNLVKGIIHQPHSRIADLPILSDDEYTAYINDFNDTGAGFSADKTMHQLFEEQVSRTPRNIAVEYNGELLTYKELNDRSNSLAAVLRKKGIAPNIVTGILLRKSPELVISILAILKAGGCYLPIETDLPEERIAYIINNSHSRLVISEKAVISSLSMQGWSKTEMLDINEQQPAMPELPETGYVSTLHNLAYIIYTSGTTGNPKGVMIEHSSLVNYISWAAMHYVKNESVAFPLFTSISFDLTVTSVFTPLITGNRIVIYEDDGRELLVHKIIADNKAGVVKLTPSHLKILRECKLPAHAAGSAIKRFIVGGEQLSAKLAREIYDQFEGNIEIYNEYGPTEATVGCMIYRFNPEDDLLNVPIGVPVSGTRIYILDKFLKPVAAGVNGELYIAGKGIARGYIFNPELTKQKFLPDPFHEGQQMYKTGDVARRLSSGLIEYTGRWDQQVKINGYRVEPAEIENRLLQHEGIAEALVIVKTNRKEQKNLYCYYKPVDGAGKGLNELVLRDFLAGSLPYYMIPVHFIAIENIPLTKNGKVDYSVLPEAVSTRAGKTNRLPATAIEELLLQTWKEVLGEAQLTISDNFFESGGDSIKAVQIASRLSEKGIQVAVKDILTYHTVEQVSLHAAVTDAGNNYEQGIVAGEKGTIPIESWFFAHRFSNPHYYNQSILLRCNKPVDTRLLEEAFRKLIIHHDGLRMNVDEGSQMLYYNNRRLEERFIIEEYEAITGDHSTAAIIQYCEQLKGSFDVTDSLLIKAALIKNAGRSDLLFITAHHLVVDGVSWRILLEDLYAVYQALENKTHFQPMPKTASLKDWERTIARYAASVVMDDYWNKFKQIHFSIPLDAETPDWTVEHLSKLSGTLDVEITQCLLKRGYQTYRADMPVLLNTALALTLKDWTGLNIFVVEQESHGRHMEDIDVSRTVGWFTAIYPVKLELKDESLSNQIKAIKEQVRMVPFHGIGYGVEKHTRARQMANMQPLAEIRFNYLGQFGRELNNELFTFSDQSTGRDSDPRNAITARLELNAMIYDDALRLEINYHNKAHTISTINWFIHTFFHHLQKIATHIKDDNDIYLTPSDFDAVTLDQEELDALFN